MPGTEDTLTIANLRRALETLRENEIPMPRFRPVFHNLPDLIIIDDIAEQVSMPTKTARTHKPRSFANWIKTLDAKEAREEIRTPAAGAVRKVRAKKTAPAITTYTVSPTTSPVLGWFELGV